MDPLAGTPWSSPGTVAGFVQSPPNAVLEAFAREELGRIVHGRLVDIGCGAGRNAVPLAAMGWQVTGLDLSWPMLEGAAKRARDEGVDGRVRFVLAPMDRLPVQRGSADVVIAHGIWNLARSSAEFRNGVSEAARVAKPGAALFVFTFSRHTLPPAVQPVEGEAFVFTEFSGTPQCFLTEAQLVAELAAAGFVRDQAVPFSEYNRPKPGQLRAGSAPVIYEGLFRKQKG